LVGILLLSLTAFSQEDIKNNSCIKIPYTVAQKIAVDLVRGDSTMAELKLTKDLLITTKDIVLKQQNIISAHEQKQVLFLEQIKIYSEKETKYKEIVLGLETDKKKLQTTVKFLGITVGVTSLTTLVLILGI
jgi:hypothetical protein